MTFERRSRRCIDLPMSCHSLRAFSGTSFGRGNRAASRASAAYEALRDDCAWRTTPLRATHSSTRHAPALRGCLQQHRASGGAGFTQPIEHAADRAAAAGLIRLPDPVVLAIDRREVDAHLRPVELQLLGENLREPRLRALPHLGGVDQQAQVAVRIDADPAGDHVRDGAVGGSQRHADIDQKDAAGRPAECRKERRESIVDMQQDDRSARSAAEGAGPLPDAVDVWLAAAWSAFGHCAISCTSTMPLVRAARSSDRRPRRIRRLQIGAGNLLNKAKCSAFVPSKSGPSQT